MSDSEKTIGDTGLLGIKEDKSMLHVLWSKAVGQSGYVKEEWRKLELELSNSTKTGYGLRYPCCEAVIRIEEIPGDASTLIGGECPVHGRSIHLPTKPKEPTPIKQHEGKKYLREITSCVNGETIEVDVYDVLLAYDVTCQATGHAIKKLLCAGQRGKGDRKADLVGVLAAINRAIQMVDE